MILFSYEIDIYYLVFFVMVVIMGSAVAYFICKEEKGVKSYFELYGKERTELFSFLVKAIFNLVPVKNGYAIWLLRLCCMVGISFIISTVIILWFILTAEI
ncbi:hypothetical protein PT286_08700 [Neisseriaceae bacterium ESL0693]|nr:hypothetical protein [Neisseriaceae bacterium ESL0693]